jgi:hypothetical protein
MPATSTELERLILAALKRAYDERRTDVEELLFQALELLDRPIAHSLTACH